MSEAESFEVTRLRAMTVVQETLIRHLEAENEKLRTALKPFADESLRFLPQHDFGVLKRRDCDAARITLSGDKHE